MKKLIKIWLAILSLGIALPAATIEIAVADTNDASQPSMTQDQTLRYKISSKINDMYPGNNIDVTIFNNQVLLTGQASSIDIKNTATRVSKEMAPNQTIFNYINIGKIQTASQKSKDALITTKVSAKILTISGVHSNDVKVVTTERVVYLMGNVTADEAVAIINNIKLMQDVKVIIDMFSYAK